MGKFDGILLITDLDGTLIQNDRTISEENANAIRYFQSEGGIFTVATGRYPDFLQNYADKFKVNSCVVGLNGNTKYFEYVHNNDEFVKLNGSYDYADMYAVAGLISDKEYYQLTNKNMDFQVNSNIVECGLKTIVENQVHENMEEILGLSNTYGRRL